MKFIYFGAHSWFDPGVTVRCYPLVGCLAVRRYPLVGCLAVRCYPLIGWLAVRCYSLIGWLAVRCYSLIGCLAGDRTNAATCDLSSILPEEVEQQVKEAAEVSMGTEVSLNDINNITHLCTQVSLRYEQLLQLHKWSMIKP